MENYDWEENMRS